jgi:hypothetical protein
LLEDKAKTKIIYPTTEDSIKDANAVLAKAFVDDVKEPESRYALAEDGFLFYLPERTHAEGDYWLFKLSYTDAKDVLKADFAELIK